MRLGYSGNRILQAQVGDISDLCRGLFQVPYAHQFSQGQWLPARHRGACWAFVLDWLRRSFNGKHSYSGAKIAKKMPAIMALQKDQQEINLRSRGLFGGYGAARIVNPNMPHARQDAYGGGYVARDGHNAQRYNPRFDDIMYCPTVECYIAQEEHRCYGIRAPGDASVPRLVGAEIVGFLRRDWIRSLVGGDKDFGWMLALRFNDFFSDAGEGGHAIGIRFSPDRRNLSYFDPNYGEGEILLDMGHLWINSVILGYSMHHAVYSVGVSRVYV